MVNQLPQGWKEEELGTLADIIAGQSPEGVYYNTVGEGTPFYQGKSEFQEMYLGKPTKWTTKVTKLAKKNDILMSVRAPVGPVNITQEDICIGRGLAAITAKSMLLQLYLFYHLRFLEDKISGTNGAVFASISKREIEQIKITYPTDRDEQNYIVKTLDAVAEMIKLRKETIQLTKDLIPAIFQEMFGDPITNPKGWEITTLGNPDICTLQYGYTATAQENGNIRYIRITDIGKDGYIDDSNIVWLNYENKMDDYKLRPKDILVARTGASYGKTLLYSNDADAIFASFLIRIIFNKKKIIPEFYWAYSLTASYWQQANRLVSGVAQPQFNGSALKQILLMLPPLSLQDEFTKKVERINKYIAVQQEELKHFETLFQSLLQEAFTGVLTWKYPRKESND